MKALHQDPDATACVGRQPPNPLWTPSKPDPWYGSIVDGERFTVQQVAALLSRGADPLTIAAMKVKRQARRTEHWYSTQDLAPRYEMECPIVGKAADGRLRVVTPNGSTALVQANGWSHHPRRLPDVYRLGYA